jgi:acyl-CoA thioester hydrolase
MSFVANTPPIFHVQDHATPLETSSGVVKPEWIDHNGHMNVAYYLMAFDESIGELFDIIGLTREHKKANNCATFVGDFHIHYARELLQGDPIRITHQVVDCDPKRIHLCQSMYHAEQGYLAARSELISLHIDMSVRRVAPMAPEIYARIAALRDAHRVLPVPPNKSRTIVIKRSGAET